MMNVNTPNISAPGMNAVGLHPSQMQSPLQSVAATPTTAAATTASVGATTPTTMMMGAGPQFVQPIHHLHQQQPQPEQAHQQQQPQLLHRQPLQLAAQQHTQQHLAQNSRGVMNMVLGNANNNANFENCIRVPSQLVGRLIGKNGVSVRRLMDETGTSITVSDNPGGQEPYSPYEQTDRVVFIRGSSMEAVNYAQAKVTSKLRSFHEADMNAGMMNSQMSALNLGSGCAVQPLMMVGGGNGGGASGMQAPQHGYAGGAYPGSGNGYGMSAASGGAHNLAAMAQQAQQAQPMYSAVYYPPQAVMPYPTPATFPQFFHAMYQQHHSGGRHVEIKCRLYVPNSVVGALIGARGCHIRELVRITRANIRIDSLPEHSRARENSSRCGGAGGSGGTAQQSPVQHSNGEKKESTSSGDGACAGGAGDGECDPQENERHGASDVKARCTDSEGATNATNAANADQKVSNNEPVKQPPPQQHGSDKCHNYSTNDATESSLPSVETGEGTSSSKSSSSSPASARGVDGDTCTGTGMDAGVVQSNGSKETVERKEAAEHQRCLSDGVKEGAVATSCGTPASIDVHEGGSRRGEHGYETRCVLITGYPAHVYQAVFHIFQKVAEGTHMHFENCLLTCEAIVPTQIVGRIIGRMGQNVRELQRLTHAYVKVPDQPNREDGAAPPLETAVKVSGNFYSVQAVQAHFAKLTSELDSHHYQPRAIHAPPTGSREPTGSDNAMPN